MSPGWRIPMLGMVLIIAALTGCATSQQVRNHRPGDAPVAGSDEDELWYAMQRAEAELQRAPQRVRDPALNEYVRKIACDVADDYCRDLRVYVMDVPEFNASMAPNGMMLVWTGALLRARDEAEIGFVLGHEAGHFRAQHSIRQWRRLKDTSAVLSAFQLVAYGAGVPDAALLGALGAYAGIFKFSRDQEREADRLGFASAVAHGYDPDAGADLWARLKREEDTRKYQRRGVVFATHPATDERMSDIRAAAGALPNPPRERRRDEYRTAMRPFMAHWLDEELGRRRYASSLLVIGELLADAPAEDHGLLTFYLGEAHRRRNANGDRAKAAGLYARAITLPGAPAASWREHGFALREAGKNVEAIAALKRYLDLAPQADDRAFVQRELEKTGERP
ncbi:MAG: M48 family metalloprotease [Lysobacter sp.]|nr:M48 family metalloprotease [Lysobacter sp.]